MMRITTTYPKRYVEINAKYCCSCGHKFYRKNRDWFTINPLCTEEFNIVRQKLANALKIKTRNCPKCGSEVKPS
jgi:predicted RNA-binding Zn-ribbon protein involved in translation (DUF1610 family)